MMVKPVVAHILHRFNNGGAEFGVRTMIQNGFYKNVDLHVIALERGQGIEDTFRQALGDDKVRFLSPHNRPAGAADLPGLVYKLAREYKRIGADATVLSLNHSALIGRLAAVVRPRMKVITFEHSMMPLTPLQGLALTLTSRRSDAVFADTGGSARFTLQYYQRHQPLYEVPLSIVRPQPERHMQTPRRFELLSLGRLEPEKNYGALIQAVGLLARAGRDVALTLAGEGTQRDALTALARCEGVSSRVRLVGQQNEEQCRALRRNSHIYVQPSLFEGQCLATVEAMGAGMMVVATRFGGAEDYGVDHKNMFKIAGYDACGIADSLGYAMDHYGTMAAMMGRAAQLTAQERFGPGQIKRLWRDAAGALLTPRAESRYMPPQMVERKDLGWKIRHPVLTLKSKF